MGYEFGRHPFRLTSIHNKKVNSPTANGSWPTFQHSIIPSFQLYQRAQMPDSPFPGYIIKLVWQRGERGGNWYFCKEYDSEGWLCPALFKYFDKAPKELYGKAEKK